MLTGRGSWRGPVHPAVARAAALAAPAVRRIAALCCFVGGRCLAEGLSGQASESAGWFPVQLAQRGGQGPSWSLQHCLGCSDSACSVEPQSRQRGARWQSLGLCHCRQRGQWTVRVFGGKWEMRTRAPSRRGFRAGGVWPAAAKFANQLVGASTWSWTEALAGVSVVERGVWPVRALSWLSTISAVTREEVIWGLLEASEVVQWVMRRGAWSIRYDTVATAFSSWHWPPKAALMGVLSLSRTSRACSELAVREKPLATACTLLRCSVAPGICLTLSSSAQVEICRAAWSFGSLT